MAKKMKYKQNAGAVPPFIEMRSGKKYLIPEKLPDTHKYDSYSQWMQDWINQRGKQAKGFAKEQYEYEHPFLSLFGTNDQDIAETTKNIQSASVNNLKTLKYKEDAAIPDDAMVSWVHGEYSPYGHYILFPGGMPEKGTIAHETGHGSRLADVGAIQDYISNTVKKDPNFTNADGYYGSPNEIYSRIWQYRKDMNVKPGDIITPQMINKHRKGYFGYFLNQDPLSNGEGKPYLSDETISKLMNELVHNNTPNKQTMARHGGKMKYCMNCGGKVRMAQNALGFGDTYNELAPVTVQGIRRRFNDASEAQVTPIRQPLGPGSVPEDLAATQGDLSILSPEQQQQYGFNWVDALHAIEDTIQSFGTEIKNVRNEKKLRIKGLQPIEEEIQEKDREGLNPASFLLKHGGKNWIQKAVNPKHKGYCTPMTKKTCTPRRKALARTFKKHHGFHQNAGNTGYSGPARYYDPWGSLAPQVQQEGWRPIGWNREYIEYGPNYGAAGKNILIDNNPQGKVVIRANKSAGNFDVMVRDLLGQHPDSFIKQGVDAATAHGYFTGPYGPVAEHVRKVTGQGMQVGGELAKRGWIKKAAASIKRRGTKGKCTPITKPGCTGRAKALALTFKKIARKRKRKGKQYGGEGEGMYYNPYVADNSYIQMPLIFNPIEMPEMGMEYAHGGPSKAKAKEMLRDGTVHGKPLTKKQKRFFGFIAGGGHPSRQQNAGLPDTETSPMLMPSQTAPMYDEDVIDIGGNDNPNPEVWAEPGEVALMQNGSIVHIDGSMPGTYDHGERRGMPGTPVDGAESFLEATSTKQGRSAMADKLLQVPVETAEMLTGYRPKKALSHATLFMQANEKHDKMRNKMQKRIKMQMERGGSSRSYKNSLSMNMKFANSIPTARDLYNKVFAHQEAVKQAFGIPDGPTEEQEDQYQAPAAQRGFSRLKRLMEEQDRQQVQQPSNVIGVNTRGNPQYTDTHKREVEEYKQQYPGIFTNFEDAYDFYNKGFGYSGSKGNILEWQKWLSSDPRTRAQLLSYLRGNTPLTRKGVGLYGNVDPKTLTNEQLLNQFQDNLFDFRSPLVMNFGEPPVSAPPENKPAPPPAVTTPSVTTPPGSSPPDITRNQKRKPPYFPLQYEDIASPIAAYLAANNRDPETLLHTDVGRVQYMLPDPTRALQNIDMNADAAMANVPSGAQGAGIRAQIQANRNKGKSDVLSQNKNEIVGISNKQEDMNVQLAGQENVYRTQNLSNFIDNYLKSRAVAGEQKLTAADKYYTTKAKNRMFNNMVSLMDPKHYTLQTDEYGRPSLDFDDSWQLQNPVMGYASQAPPSGSKGYNPKTTQINGVTYQYDRGTKQWIPANLPVETKKRSS
jgi:hypothetical protein